MILTILHFGVRKIEAGFGFPRQKSDTCKFKTTYLVPSFWKLEKYVRLRNSYQFRLITRILKYCRWKKTCPQTIAELIYAGMFRSWKKIDQNKINRTKFRETSKLPLTGLGFPTMCLKRLCGICFITVYLPPKIK
jgi:hypothetical protein